MGPPNLCNATGIQGLYDVEYIVPPNTTWSYCYVIHIPTESEECIYDITLTDSPPLGAGQRNVTTPSELVCPGEMKYIAGPTRSFSQAPEAYSDAIVQGYGYYSGTLVSSKDGSAVKR